MKNNNISYLRFLAIIAIVLHHSFCAFGGWPPNHCIGGYVPEHASLASGVLKTFGLGVFTFISGYLLYYQVDKKEVFTTFLVKKVKRIIVPCIFWAIIYGLFFSSFMYEDWPSPINGTHLWYLPMLFISILIVSSDIFIKRSSYIIIGISWLLFIVASRCWYNRIFSEVPIYLPILMLGYMCNKYKFTDWLASRKPRSYALISGGGNMLYIN